MPTDLDAELLSPAQRLRYRLMPGRWYAGVRARRDLRKYESELHLLPFLVDPQRTSVDVGANRGSYTYFLAELSKQVFAYEPNPAMFEYLQGVAAENVTVLRAALSDTTGSAEFTVPRRQTGCHNTRGSIETAQFDDDVVTFSIDIRRLDDEADVGNLGFLKIDAEGHEMSVLRGGAETIRTHQPVMLIEIATNLSPIPVDDAVREIEQLGYETFCVINGRLVHNSLVMSGTSQSNGRPISAAERENFLFLPRAR